MRKRTKSNPRSFDSAALAKDDKILRIGQWFPGFQKRDLGYPIIFGKVKEECPYTFKGKMKLIGW